MPLQERWTRILSKLLRKNQKWSTAVSYNPRRSESSKPFSRGDAKNAGRFFASSRLRVN